MKNLLVLSVVVAGCATEPDPPLRVGTACPRDVLREVNDAWIAAHPDPGNDRWARAVYFTGDLAAYEALGEPAYLDYAVRWAESHDWRLHGGSTTRDADDHTAGQVYLALDAIDPDRDRIAAIKGALHRVVEDDARDDWSWIDAMYMASPAYAALTERTGDPRYAATMYELYLDTKERRGLYDADVSLWYRDESYLYPDVTTPSGEKVFWSRGNGWVIASIVRTLEQLPADSSYRGEYVTTLREMAAAIAPLQRSDGFWSVSLHDPAHYGGRETSGTALFAYAFAWAIRDGILDRDTYLPVVERAWRGIVDDALLEGGGVGFVQDVGEEPASAQPVTLGSTADFGVGAVLLAGSEVDRLDLDWGCRR